MERGQRCTIRPEKPIPAHTGIFKLHLEANATLQTAKVHEAVKLPLGIDENEWIASQVLGLYEEVIHLMCLLEEFCTEECCPVMSAGKYVTYTWNDPHSCDENKRKTRNLSAPDYMRTLASYAFEVLSNREIVPIDGSSMPPGFRDHMRTLLKRFFRIYAHTYIHHFIDFRDAGVEAELNCCFKRYLFFVLEFGLVSRADMRPMKDLIEKFEGEATRRRSMKEIKEGDTVQFCGSQDVAEDQCVHVGAAGLAVECFSDETVKVEWHIGDGQVATTIVNRHQLQKFKDGRTKHRSRRDREEAGGCVAPAVQKAAYGVRFNDCSETSKGFGLEAARG